MMWLVPTLPGCPQVRRPRRNIIPSDDEDQGTPIEPSIDSMLPPFHARANYADVVPPASQHRSSRGRLGSYSF